MYSHHYVPQRHGGHHLLLGLLFITFISTSCLLSLQSHYTHPLPLLLHRHRKYNKTNFRSRSQALEAALLVSHTYQMTPMYSLSISTLKIYLDHHPLSLSVHIRQQSSLIQSFPSTSMDIIFSVRVWLYIPISVELFNEFLRGRLNSCFSHQASFTSLFAHSV